MRTLCNVMIVMPLQVSARRGVDLCMLWDFYMESMIGITWSIAFYRKNGCGRGGDLAYVCMTFVFFRAEHCAGVDVLKALSA